MESPSKRVVPSKALEPLSSSSKKSKLDPSVLVLGVDDVSTRMQGASFEGLVLNRYGTWDQGGNSYNFLYCDLIDCKGFQTITMTIGETVAQRHPEYLLPGLFVQSPISMWLLKPNLNWEIQLML